MADQYNCMICDMPIKEALPDQDHLPDHQKSWSNGIVDHFNAWYGSEHDMNTFIGGICDDCIYRLLEDGQIKIDNLKNE